MNSVNTVDAAIKLLGFIKHTSPKLSGDLYCFKFDQFQELTNLLDGLETALRLDGLLKTGVSINPNNVEQSKTVGF